MQGKKIKYVDCTVWSTGDMQDKSPVFPLFDLRLDGKTDSAACSEIIGHGSYVEYVRSVWLTGGESGEGPPRGCGSSVLLCFVFGRRSASGLTVQAVSPGSKADRY